MVETPSSGREDVFACPVWGKVIELNCACPQNLKIQGQSFAEAALTQITAPPLTITQGGLAADDPHRFHLVHLLEGHGTYSWAGGAVTQMPGDIVIVDTVEPSQLVSQVESRLVRWSFPEALISPFLPPRDDSAILQLPAHSGVVAVLAQYTIELAREAHRVDHTVRNALLAHLCGLIGLAVEAEAAAYPPRRHGYRTLQYRRLLTYIETHLRDPHLTAKYAAQALGMSRRWLHALVKEGGEGFSALLTRRRLEESRKVLSDPGCNHLSIAEIAFLVGFNDVSTFHRRFRRYYGVTPHRMRTLQ